MRDTCSHATKSRAVITCPRDLIKYPRGASYISLISTLVYSLVRILHLKPLVLYSMHSLHVFDEVTALSRSYIAEVAFVGTLAEVSDGDVAPQGRAARVCFVAYSTG